MDSIAPVQYLPPTPDRSVISSSAQSRILIWRTEVASACEPLSPTTADGSATSAASLTNSSSSTTHTASSSSPRLSLARGRRFLRRLSRRLSGRSLDDDLLHRQEQITRTAMYRALAQPSIAELAAFADEAEMGLGEKSSHGDNRAAGGLQEKQERLMRAARLLQQGPV